jgi:hypothetical protein
MTIKIKGFWKAKANQEKRSNAVIRKKLEPLKSILRKANSRKLTTKVAYNIYLGGPLIMSSALSKYLSSTMSHRPRESRRKKLKNTSKQIPSHQLNNNSKNRDHEKECTRKLLSSKKGKEEK